MSIEQRLAELTAAVNNLTAVMIGQQHAPAPVAAPAPAPVAAPAPAPVAAPAPAPVAAPAPAPVAAPAPAPVAAPASSMPPLPFPVETSVPVAAPAPVTTAVTPFQDGAGLVKYVMTTYQALGPEKGALIQGVLQALGYTNINDVRPEHYGALYAGVEALRA